MYGKILSYTNLGVLSFVAFLGTSHASDDAAQERAARMMRQAASKASTERDESVARALGRPDLVHLANSRANTMPLAQFAQTDPELNNVPIPQNIFTVAPAPKMSHVSAIGEVLLSRYRGTATYLGDHIAITASHVISSFFTSKSPKASGPHYIDLRGKYAYWRFDPKRHKDGHKDGNERTIRIVGLVAESIYVNTVNHNSSKISPHEQKYDISFLILDPTQTAGLPEMQLIDKATGFEKTCAMMGYAKLKNGGKGRHKVAVELSIVRPKEEWDCLTLLSDSRKAGEFKPQAEALLDTVLPENELVSNIIRSGDSGGSLIALTKDGRKVQIGVNSVSTSPGPGGFSGCASLMTGSHQTGWKLSPKVKAQWDYAKAMQQQHHKK